MGLNISKGDMYPWITHTWNTVKGACPHGCTYCYMKRFKNQKPVRFDKKELKEFDRDCKKYGPGLFIFVGSSCDMFAEEIPVDWIAPTILQMDLHRENKYLLQSKNPYKIGRWMEFLTSHTVICTTIESNRFYRNIMNQSPAPQARAGAMEKLSEYERYVTIEPIMDFDLAPMVELIKRCEPVQVNIGADSGNNHLPEPSADKVLAFIDRLKTFTTIVNKRNLSRILGAYNG